MQEGIAIHIVQLITVDMKKKSKNKLFKYQLHIQNVQHLLSISYM